MKKSGFGGSSVSLPVLFTGGEAPNLLLQRGLWSLFAFSHPLIIRIFSFLIE
jgi:hypothetical protein